MASHVPGESQTIRLEAAAVFDPINHSEEDLPNASTASGASPHTMNVPERRRINRHTSDDAVVLSHSKSNFSHVHEAYQQEDLLDWDHDRVDPFRDTFMSHSAVPSQASSQTEKTGSQFDVIQSDNNDIAAGRKKLSQQRQQQQGVSTSQPSNSGGIRASLDAGMAAMGRWIRTHNNNNNDVDIDVASYSAEVSLPNAIDSNTFQTMLPTRSSNSSSQNNVLQLLSAVECERPIKVHCFSENRLMLDSVPHSHSTVFDYDENEAICSMDQNTFDCKLDSETQGLIRGGDSNHSSSASTTGSLLRQRALSEPEVKKFLKYHRPTPPSAQLRQRKQQQQDVAKQQQSRDRASTAERMDDYETQGAHVSNDGLKISEGTLMDPTRNVILLNSTSAVDSMLPLRTIISIDHTRQSIPAATVPLESPDRAVDTLYDRTNQESVSLYDARTERAIFFPPSAVVSPSTTINSTPSNRFHSPTSTSPDSTRSSTGGNTGQDSNGNTRRSEIDRDRLARIRWIRINRRFQLVITFVALLFSALLFAILICWVSLTSAYVMSLRKECTVPLKGYYWLITLQLVLDIFRSDILRYVFRWDSRSNERVPGRVALYNIAYLIYALLVLRKGIIYAFLNDERQICRSTAAGLFNASLAYVSLSISAWAVIILGYVVPFCVVAAMLTLNGYNPSSSATFSIDGVSTNNTTPVYPAAYATSGAPPSFIEQLTVVSLQDLVADSYPRECCICMEDFCHTDVVVETGCHHVFHKSCCREWLRQATTCPVCRVDIAVTHPGSRNVLENNIDASTSVTSAEPTSIPIGPSGHNISGLLRAVRRFTERTLGMPHQVPDVETTVRAPRDAETGIPTRTF